MRADGSPLLVCVGHADCETSTLMLPFVDRMHARGARVLVVLQDARDDARALVGELGLRARVLRDEEPHALGQALGLVGVPVLYLLDGESRVRRVSEGFVRADLEELAAALSLSGPLFGPEDRVPERRPG